MNRYLETHKELKKAVQTLVHGHCAEATEILRGHLADMAERATEQGLSAEGEFGMRARGGAKAFRFLCRLFEDCDEPDQEVMPQAEPKEARDPFPDD